MSEDTRAIIENAYIEWETRNKWEPVSIKEMFAAGWIAAKADTRFCDPQDRGFDKECPVHGEFTPEGDYTGIGKSGPTVRCTCGSHKLAPFYHRPDCPAAPSLADTQLERPAEEWTLPITVIDDCVRTIITDCLSGIEMGYLDSRVRARLHVLMSLQRKWIAKHAPQPPKSGRGTGV